MNVRMFHSSRDLLWFGSKEKETGSNTSCVEPVTRANFSWFYSVLLSLESRYRPRELPESSLPIRFSHSKLIFDTTSYSYILVGYGILFEYLNYIASDDTMIDELERTWKEAVVAYSRYCSGIFLEGLRNCTQNLPGWLVSRLSFESSTSKYTSRALSLDQPVRYNAVWESTNTYE
jgi:hypothetical protein